MPKHAPFWSYVSIETHRYKRNLYVLGYDNAGSSYKKESNFGLLVY